jgi:nucleoside-diphosphate-sugar epimerase
MTTVFITGINGFVGRNLASFFKDKGYVVKGSVSNLSKMKDVQCIADEVTQIRLGEEIKDNSIPSGIDVFIYAVYGKNNAASNIESNKQLYKLALAKGCGHHIFISSISADPTNPADYGKVKLELEAFFLEKKNTLIIRPGLVLGDGGLYRNMENFVKSHLIVPLPDGGKYKMAVVGMNQFSEALDILIQKNIVGTYALYRCDLVSLKEIVTEIAKEHKKRIFILPIPIDFTLNFRCEKVLQKGGGVVLIDPYYGFLSNLFYKRAFKTEFFDKDQLAWDTEASVMLDANQALTYIVFVRDREMFLREFPGLEIVESKVFNNYIRYVCSGGLNFKQLLPNIAIPFLKLLEVLMRPVNKIFGLHHVIVLRKK